MLPSLLAEQGFESSSRTFSIHSMTLGLNLGDSLSVVRGPNVLCITKKEKVMSVKLLTRFTDCRRHFYLGDVKMLK